MMVPARIARRSARHGEAGYRRRKHDAYFTEPRCTWALVPYLDRERLRGRLWEPCCGKGHIVKVLLEAGHRVAASDLHDHRGLKAGRSPALTVRYGVDFLAIPPRARPAGVTGIVTNVPFDRAELFVRRALALSPPDGLVAILLNHQFDTVPGRVDLFEQAPFAFKLVMTWRPHWVEERRASPRENFAWYVWDRSLRRPTALLRYAR
jgi:hypothetical protein